MAELRFFDKPMSIKPDVGMINDIDKYLDGVAENPPKTAKELMVSLLNQSKNAIQKAEIDELRTNVLNLDNANKDLQADISRLQVENSGLLTEKTSLQAENERLQKEIDGLQADFKEFTKPETLYRGWIDRIKEQLPHFYKDGDTTPADTMNRILYVLDQAQADLLAANKRADALENQLEEALVKPYQPRRNEAIIEFTVEQKQAIQIARAILAKTGHQFGSDNVDETLHSIVSSFNRLAAVMFDLSQKSKPYTGIQNLVTNE